MTDKRPWIALLGIFPPFYLVGLIRNWGEPWCTWSTDLGSIGISAPFPALWWPIKLYQHKKRQNRRYADLRSYLNPRS